MITLRLAGPMELLRGTERVLLPKSRKTRALLGYLALTGRAHTRERLCELLWEIPDDPRAALRWSLAKLRRLVDEPDRPRLLSEGDTVRFEREGMLIDVLDARRRVAEGLSQASTPELEQLAWSFRGDLLEGLDLSDHQDFYVWCVAEREAARLLHARILHELVDRLADDPQRALPFARTLVQITGHEAQAQALFDRVLRATRAEPQAAGAHQPSASVPARSHEPEPDRRPTTVAVLPFRTGAGDPLEAEIADAVADELITVLSKLSGLSVIARDSVFALRDSNGDRHELTASLGASHVLSGVVRRAGDRLRVTAQLDEQASGECMWADRFESGRADVFSILDEICDRIVTALEVRLTFGEQVRLWRRRMTNLDAYTCYLKAIEHYNRFQKEENAVARAELDKAIALDPEFAAAYAYLGWVHATDAHFGWRANREALLQHSLDLADQALDLDSTLADAYAVRAFAFTLLGEHDAALHEAERAAELNPNGATVLHVCAMARTFAGSPQDAVDLERQALRLSPIAQENYLLELARALSDCGRHEEALEALGPVLESRPDWLTARTLAVAAHAALGQRAECDIEVAQVLRINPKFSTERWGALHPYRDAADSERFKSALLAAGLPP
jgi:TolB-like protein